MLETNEQTSHTNSSIARQSRRLRMKEKRDAQCTESDHSQNLVDKTDVSDARKKRRLILQNKKSSCGHPSSAPSPSTVSPVSIPNVQDRAHSIDARKKRRLILENRKFSIIEPETQYSQVPLSNSEDDCSSSNTSDSEDDMEQAPLADSNLQGDQIWECTYCHAHMWLQERASKTKKGHVPTFHRCCRGGKIVVPLLEEPPPLLRHLVFNKTSTESKNYRNNIRTYNSMFSFTSPGMKFDTTYSKKGGPPTLRLHGQTCHRIGTLLPKTGDRPQYAQLYISDIDNEVTNRMKCFRDNTEIDKNTVHNLKIMLDEFNIHAKVFRMARDVLDDNAFLDLNLRVICDRPEDGRVYNRPTVSEVAALIVGDIDSACNRDIIIQARNGGLQRIDEFHPAYLAYQYPLIFVYGGDGYMKNILHRYRHETEVTRQNRQSIKDWLSYRLQNRSEEAKTLLHSRRLFQQFLVDGYCTMESERLNWLRNNQSKLRVGKYNRLTDECNNDDGRQQQKRGKRVVLPSSFVGGKRCMDQLYFDGMAISSRLGFPDLFITFTWNPTWPEIIRALSETGLQPHDRPDIITKVFKIKFDELIAYITKKRVLGKVLAFMYTIEFHKRGLPHVYILIFLHSQSKYPTPSDIDNIICAEIPDPAVHPRLYALVKSNMMHGPCGVARTTSTCMKNGKCSKYFPKKFNEETIVDAEGYPLYRRRSKTHIIEKNGITLDNRHVVPYNKRFLLKYNAHINIEWCNQSTSIKYLFKYISKGYDRITASVSTNNNEPVDEIKQYLDCRYISPCEACWRIYSFHIHGRRPAVERMFYHLVGEKAVYYTDHDRMENVLENASVTDSMFTGWLSANSKYTEAQSLTYGQFVSKFVYHKKEREWRPRKKGFTIGRLIWVPPTTGELFYLWMMLTVAKRPKSYEEIRKVGNNQYEAFRDACFALGFLEDDKEYIGAVNRPTHVWKDSWQLLSDGVLHAQRQLALNTELVLTEAELQNLTLIEIEKLLQENKRTLKDFKPIPYPDGYVLQQLGNRLIYDERNYDIAKTKTEFTNLFGGLTVMLLKKPNFVKDLTDHLDPNEQRAMYQKIMRAVESQNGAVFFLHGYGGTGKTYMWRTLAAALRSKHDICLTVATSGITSLLLPGGRTAYSKFKIPVPTLDNSTCKIEYNDDVGDLLRQTKLIIWDEAPMILPVVPRGSRSDIVHSAINASYIWNYVQVLTLTKNTRLQSGLTQNDKNEMQQFSEWLLRIGEGKVSEPNDGVTDFEVPPDLLITQFEDPIVAIVDATYPDFIHNFHSIQYLKDRAILASTLEIVEQINNHILDLIPGDMRDYYSSNSVDKSEINDDTVVNILTPKFLSSLRTSGLPTHHLKLKVGTPIMLMRNIDQSEGLCNGTRLIVTKLGTHVIEASIIAGKSCGNQVYIPRMDMSPSQSPWPFKLNRRQFPIILSYAMTINKSQGQSLDTVGLYLPRDVFTHGQIYVALSRVTTKQGIKILIHDQHAKVKTTTTNVVYKEIFDNI
ncbi:uncharacterized protein LOC131604509 [Vicia villosa]|uniref:uncharacterized protein LOC131604509 n=1 Tax=Vicia villosa TaxID=3911 RepID=UPI00273AA662|nr:uncharacterized protein LOC131604509 [Vicia villosa]